MNAKNDAILEVASLDWQSLLKRSFSPSPMAWEEQVFYFLLVDRFSDGNERDYRDNSGDLVDTGTTPLLQRDGKNALPVLPPACLASWRKAGGGWCGGNLRGLTSKLGYLKRLGITTLWISPILKQARYAADSYHGYGVQNFLEIDPHFGSREDLVNLVETAHAMGMYVLLDVILNHTGDVFAYAEPQPENWREAPYPVAGFRDAHGQPSLSFGPLGEEADTEAGIWPRELQSSESFTCKGPIQDWEAFPEYEQGDFFGLKDLYLGKTEGDTFQPSSALLALTEVYKYWIAVADLDGLRLDTVKHMPEGAVAYFVDQIHQFVGSIGKRNFYIVGEIVGERGYTSEKLHSTDMDAALGISEVPRKIRAIVEGQRRPADYFEIFANSKQEDDNAPEPIWWRNRVVTFFDDHDQVGKPVKSRFAHDFGGDSQQAERGILRAVALHSLTLGIPCLYYGTEQGFDGYVPQEGDPLWELEQELQKQQGDGPANQDQFVRECLFGGAFGPFRTQGKHCFQEASWLYQQIAALLALRQEHQALRCGPQYLRELSADGSTFWLPEPGEQPYLGIIAWSRLQDSEEFLCAINTNPTQAQHAYISIDDIRNGQERIPLHCLYSTEETQIGQEAVTQSSAIGIAVAITVPAGGVVVFH